MFDELIRSASLTYDVPEAWIRAVIDVESSWNPRAYRYEARINDASYGLMQLLGRTATALGYAGSTEGLYDPQINIDLGSRLLGQLRSSYDDDFRRVYSAYNSGNPDLWERSTQVAAHVSRAVAALEKYAAEVVHYVVGAGQESPVASSGLVALLVAVLLWAWTTKRR